METDVKMFNEKLAHIAQAGIADGWSVEASENLSTEFNRLVVNVNPEDPMANLTVYFHEGKTKGQVHAGVSYGPRNTLQAQYRHSYSDPHCSIQFSPNKPVGAIVKDLKGRLLPGALAYLHVLLVREAEAEAYAHKVEGGKDLLRNVFPELRDGHRPETLSFHTDGGAYGDFYVSGSATVNIKLDSVPFALALAIAALLNVKE